MKNKIVILSGGMDSVTLLYKIVKEYGNENIIALTFDYGSKHNCREIPMAEENCKLLKVRHKILDLKSIFSNFNSALLNHKDSEDIPQGDYEEDNMKKTVVPFRNGILLSIAVGFAESMEADVIFYGAHAGDHDVYPDCRKEFVDSINNTSQLGTYNNVKIKSPFWDNTKIDIIKIGNEIKVDYSKTWTCYEGKEEPCGKCGSCVERTEGFYENNLKDPLYKSNETWQKAVDYMKKVLKK